MCSFPELKDRKFLVADTGSAVGQELVEQLTGLGAYVVVIGDPNGSPLQSISAFKESKCYISFDIYDNSETESNFHLINEKFGLFNGFVYCAGIGGVRPLSMTKYSFMHEMMNANVYSFVEMARCLAKRNCFSDGGSMVAISSVSSIKGLKSKIAYSASKSALDAIVRCIAAELSPRRIRVNSIMKGAVSSDLNKDYIQSNIKLGEEDDLKRQLLGIIEPSEIADCIVFLLSDSSKKITGTSILLDGGYVL